MPSISDVKDTSSVSLTYRSLKREKFPCVSNGWVDDAKSQREIRRVILRWEYILLKTCVDQIKEKCKKIVILSKERTWELWVLLFSKCII